MGWDAYSSAERTKKFNLKDPLLKIGFKDATKEIKKAWGTVDAALIYGCLDCYDCANMLEKATGQSCYNPEGWDVEKVKKLQLNAYWDFDFSAEDGWAHGSAKKFLELCAKHGLSIKFSW